MLWPSLSSCTFMMTSSNGNIFHVTGPLWGEFTCHQWIPLTKASDAELWCFLWFAPEQTIEQTIVRLVIRDAIHDVSVMNKPIIAHTEIISHMQRLLLLDCSHVIWDYKWRLGCFDFAKWPNVPYKILSTNSHICAWAVVVVFIGTEWSFPDPFVIERVKITSM